MLDPETIIRSGGVFLIAAIIFAESGLLVGFFLPGDTLLFGAGLAASQGQISLPWLIVAVVLAAIIGDNVGYSIGRRTGNRIFNKKDGIIFRKEHLEIAEQFYDKHGGKTIILARFTPLVRTFAPVVAGAGKMSRRRFFAFNIIGGILWGAGMPLLGYYIGSKIPGLDHYIEYVIIGVVLLSLVLAFGHLLRDKQTREQIFARGKTWLSRIFLNKKID
jgi:membrane-associated protein